MLDEGMHGFGGINRIEQDSLRPRDQSDGLAAALGHRTVALTDITIIDIYVFRSRSPRQPHEFRGAIRDDRELIEKIAARAADADSPYLVGSLLTQSAEIESREGATRPNRYVEVRRPDLQIVE